MWWQIGISIIILVVFCFIVYRIFKEKPVDMEYDEKPILNAKTIFVLAIGFRLLVYFVSFIIMDINGVEIHSLKEFCNQWVRWDSGHYIDIAQKGYGGSLENGQALFLVFFPMYSYLLRFVVLVFKNYEFSGMLISTISYAIGMIYLYKLVLKEYGNKAAINTCILFSLFPFGFFVGGIMTEGVFFLFSVATLYYIRIHKWSLVFLFGLLSCMTRMYGMFLVIPATLEFLIYEKPLDFALKKQWRSFWEMCYKKFIWIPMMLLGIVYYFNINWDVTGNPLQFSVYQKEHWNQGFCLFTKTLKYLIGYSVDDSFGLSDKISIWYPEITIFVFALIILLIGLKKMRVTYLSYFFVYFLVTYSVTWLLSAGRYMSLAIPMFMILGDVSKKSIVLKISLYTLFGFFFVFYLFRYMNNWQVM